ncbi:hypothetical protein ACS0TY_015147 [Phlomoides rotata]
MEGVTSPPLVQGSTKNSYINPLLISLLGVVFTFTAILAYHLVLVKYCIRRHASSAAAAQSTAASKPPTGVDEKVLRTIPIVAFSAVKRGMEDDQLDECVVCLGELEDEDLVRLLPNCKHAFHASCIDQWFAAHQSCPMCRSPIQEQNNAAESLDPHRADDSERRGTIESGAINSSGAQPSPARERSSGLLRHCASLVLPPPPVRSDSRFKRSVSLDRHRIIVVINNHSSDSSSSRGILSRSGSCSAPSLTLTHIDRASAKWFRSLSRLQMGKGRNGVILPY